MHKTGMLFTLLLVFGMATLQATPVACDTSTTLAALIATNAGGGCFSQDKIFSAFSYTGTDATSLIDASLVVQAAGPGQEIHGWLFTNGNTFKEWLNDFTLGFTITVNPTFPLVTIFASKDQIDSGGIPNGTKVTDTQSIGVLTVNGLSTANETMQVSYSPVTAVTTSSAVTIPTGSLLLKYDQTFFENTGTGVPEPATYGLLGGGLLLLGAMRRARSRT